MKMQVCHFDQKHLRNELLLKLPSEKGENKFLSFKQHSPNRLFISLERTKKYTTKRSQQLNKLISGSLSLFSLILTHTVHTHILTHTHTHTPIYIHIHTHEHIYYRQTVVFFLIRGIFRGWEMDHTGCQLCQNSGGIKY